MKFHKILTIAAAFTMLLSSFLVAPVSAQSSVPIIATRQINAGGTTSLQAAPMGTSLGQGPEIDPATSGEEDTPNAATGVTVLNRSFATSNGNGVNANSGKKAKSNPELNLSFDGLNLYQQRFANDGNQFTVEPPDQGLCVGNGYVLETVNDVVRVFDTNGNPLTDVIDQNSFYQYPAAINRTTGEYGPSITDPSCLFDQDTGRWFHVVLTLDRVGTTSALAGPNHLDIAVSQTSDPTGAWTIYRIPVQNNGTDGTPDHGCSGGFCLGDYPHIGADATGFYITTNEFALFGPGYYGANIYAFSKRQLAAGGPINVTQIYADYYPAFTVWPAISPAGQYRTDNGGTEFFLSTDAVFSNDGTSSQIWQWSLTNTSSLDSASPSLNLSLDAIPTLTYGVPPRASQKAGDYPLGQSLNDPLGRLDANDSRTQQVVYANGKLWTAIDTSLTINNTTNAGVAYFIVNPGSHKVMRQGYLGLENNNLTYPAVGVTASGRGVIAFTLVGQDYYPTAGYASLDAKIGAGDIHVASPGLGPQDGFTEYRQYTNRPRWGDYGAAAMDGNSIWIASEYIGQTCTLAQYTADDTCGGTRAPLGNWGTRISQLTP